MIYLKCPSCKTLLGDKEISYYEGLKKICTKVNISKNERDILTRELLDKLHINNICCVPRVICNIRNAEKIK